MIRTALNRTIRQWLRWTQNFRHSQIATVRTLDSTQQNSSSGLALISLGAIGVVGGIVHQSGGAITIGALLIAFPAIVYFALRHSIQNTSFERILPQSAFEGDEVEVVLSVHNNSRLPLFQPLVSDCFSPELHATKNVLFPDRIRPGERTEQSYIGNCILPRGLYSIGALRLTLTDPFGWFQMRRTIAKKPRFKVYPAVQQLDQSDDLGRTLAKIVSELTHGGPGESDEFFAVREYRRGDSLRKIHWGLTARRGVPVVREFTQNSAGDLTVVIDRHREALLGIGRGSSMEHAVKITAALASRSLSRGHRVQVVAGPTSDFCVSPGSGSDYLQHILELLVRVRPNDDTSLSTLIDSASQGFAPGSTLVVMLSPYSYHDRGLLDRLAALKRQGTRILAVVFDSESFRQLWSESRNFDSSEDFAVRLKRQGIFSVLLPCSADLRAALSREVA